MSLTRITAAAALAGALSLIAGCGNSRADTGAGALGSTEPAPLTSAPDTAPVTPATTPAAPGTTAATPTRTPTKTPSASGGDGDATDNNAPSTAGGGVCSHLGAGQIGSVLGVAVRGTAVPGETGCTFDHGGTRGMSVTVLDKSTAQAGGMAGARSDANSAVEGQPQDLPGIGTAAFVITGSMFGGPDVNAAGAAQVGGRILSVYLVQHSGTDEAKVRDLEVRLLQLVAKAHG